MFELLVRYGMKPWGIGRRFTPDQTEAERRGACHLLRLDLSDDHADDALAMLRCVDASTDRIIFVNNAGVVTPIGKLESIARQDLSASLAVNFFGPLLIAQHLLGYSKSLEIPLRILNISSGAAKRAIPGWAAYCAGKSAISMAFQCLAAEEPLVEAIDIDPGVLDTDMQAEIRAAGVEHFPWLDEFVRLKQEKLLKDPAVVAKSIVSQWVLV